MDQFRISFTILLHHAYHKKFNSKLTRLAAIIDGGLSPIIDGERCRGYGCEKYNSMLTRLVQSPFFDALRGLQCFSLSTSVSIFLKYLVISELISFIFC